MLHTVPLDRTGTQPRPRQAKAIVCSCLLSLLLLSLFFVFPLQTPCHLSLSATFSTLTDLSETFLCKSCIQTRNICRHRPSPSISSATHPSTCCPLLSPPFSWPNTSLEKEHFLCPFWRAWLWTRRELHSTHKELCTYVSSQSQTLLCPVTVISMSHPRRLMSDGRILPGHGLSLTVISLWCSNMWREGWWGGSATKY